MDMDRWEEVGLSITLVSKPIHSYNHIRMINGTLDVSSVFHLRWSIVMLSLDLWQCHACIT